MTEMTTEQNNDHAVQESGGSPLPSHINPDVLQNISVSITVEVGRTSMKIRDLMELGEAQAKNSESLSRSPSPPAATTSE